MSKFQVLINVYFDDETKADNLFKYLETLKADMVKFTNAAGRVDVSNVDLIKNEHDGLEFSPCTLLKNFKNDSVKDEFVDYDKTVEESK